MICKLLGKYKTVFNDYKKISLYLPIGISCTGKCMYEIEKQCGYIKPEWRCQNEILYHKQPVILQIDDIINYYKENVLLEAIIMSGLEPFDNFSDCLGFINKFRQVSEDDICIYSGYYPEEIQGYIDILKQFKNIIIKFGRFIPDSDKRYDDVLGVWLASDNQYAERIS